MHGNTLYHARARAASPWNLASSSTACRATNLPSTRWPDSTVLSILMVMSSPQMPVRMDTTTTGCRYM